MDQTTERLLSELMKKPNGAGVQLYIRPISSLMVEPKKPEMIYYKAHTDVEGRQIWAEGYVLNDVLVEIINQIPPHILSGVEEPEPEPKPVRSRHRRRSRSRR